MAKLILADLTNLTSGSAVATINNNSTLIETSLENTLSRDGTAPNEMEADLDMNSNRILNCVDPTTDQEPTTKSYVDDLVDTTLQTIEDLLTTSGLNGGAYTGVFSDLANLNLVNGDLLYVNSSGHLVALPTGTEGYVLKAGTPPTWEASRKLLTADTAFYVSPSGSNSNDGLTVGTPWLTLQHAYDYITETLDLGGFNITVNMAVGTYTGGLATLSPWTGGGNITFVGNSGDPSSVIIAISGTPAHCIYNSSILPGSLFVNGVTFTNSSGGNGLNNGGTGIIGTINSRFGTHSGTHLVTEGTGAQVQAFNYTVVGNATYHMVATGQSQIYVAGAVNMSGTPAFSITVVASRMGLIVLNGASFSGAATGTRYSADLGGGIFTNGGGASFIPGNAGGSATSPGWYN